MMANTKKICFNIKENVLKMFFLYNNYFYVTLFALYTVSEDPERDNSHGPAALNTTATWGFHNSKKLQSIKKKE